MPHAPHVLSATAYLQIRRYETYYGRPEARVIRTTQNKPERPEPNTVVVKLRINIPAAAFDPLEPEAIVDIPPHLIQHAVAVDAVRE